MFKSILCAALLIVVSPLTAAKLPDWTSASITPEALAWKQKSPEVMLLDETLVSYETPGLVRCTERGVLKINQTEEGKTRRVIYHYNTNSDKILSLSAWLQKPDGKTSLLPKSQLMDMPYSSASHSWNNHRVLWLSYPTKPEPGSILAWEIVSENKSHPIHGHGTGFSASPPLFLGKFSATPPVGSRLVVYQNTSTSTPPQTDASGKITWSLSRHSSSSSGFPDGFFPSGETIAVTCPTPEIPLRNWSDFATAVDQLYQPTSVVTPELRALAESLTAGKATRWEKIRALTDFIQANVSYLNMDDDDSIITGQIPLPASTCLGNRYGDCKDKANLLVTLLRAIGDNGHVLLVYSGNPTRVPADTPISSFNHAITAIPADADTPDHWPIATHPKLGRFVIVDTTSGVNPLGTLPIRDQGGLGLLIHPQGDIIRLPTDTAGHHGTEITAIIKLLPDHSAQLHLVENARGQTAALLQYTRENAREKNFKTILEKRLNRLAPRHENLQWSEAASTNLHTLTYDCTLLGLLRQPSPDISLLTPPILSRPNSLDPWKTERPGQCWLPLSEHLSTLTIELLPGYTLDNPAEPLVLTHGNIHATYAFSIEDKHLVVKTHYLRTAGFYTKPDYEALRALTAKYLQALRSPILLKRTAAL